MEIIKVLSAKFEKPRRRYSSEGERFDWYAIATTDKNLPHGSPMFGSDIRKTEEGMYQAKTWDNVWGASAPTRMAALQNIVEANVTSATRDIETRQAFETAKNARWAERNRLNDFFPAGIEVSIENLEKINETPRYSIHISEQSVEQIKLWVKLFDDGTTRVKV